MIFFIPKEKGKSFLGLNNSVKNVCFQAIKKGGGAKNVSKLIYTPFFYLKIHGRRMKFTAINKR